MCLSELANQSFETGKSTYCVSEVDEGITTNDTDQVKEHDCWKEVLRLEVDWQEQYTELSSRILHAKSAENTKQSTTRSTAPNEDLRDDASVLRKHGSKVLRVSGKHTRGEEECSYVRRIALEQL